MLRRVPCCAVCRVVPCDAVLAVWQSGVPFPSPGLAFVPVIYLLQGGVQTLATVPDLLLVLDAPLFYFRNELQGAGPWDLAG